MNYLLCATSCSRRVCTFLPVRRARTRSGCDRTAELERTSAARKRRREDAYSSRFREIAAAVKDARERRERKRKERRRDKREILEIVIMYVERRGASTNSTDRLACLLQI